MTIADGAKILSLPLCFYTSIHILGLKELLNIFFYALSCRCKLKHTFCTDVKNACIFMMLYDII